jgi:hypothetical protein
LVDRRAPDDDVLEDLYEDAAQATYHQGSELGIVLNPDEHLHPALVHHLLDQDAFYERPRSLFFHRVYYLLTGFGKLLRTADAHAQRTGVGLVQDVGRDRLRHNRIV